MNWINDDEDLIFAKLIVIRLKKFASKDRRTVRIVRSYYSFII